MLNNATIKSVKDWIVYQEAVGSSTFAVSDLCQQFPEKSKKVLAVDLCRLTRRGLIQPVHKGFYVTIPARYRLIDKTPVRFYINDLCLYLGRPYYLGLLSAAEMYGAAHQKPQLEQVVTAVPRMTTSKRKNVDLQWVYREKLPTEFLVERKGENGPIMISSAELTALDLVQYSQWCGGMSNVATVLAELSEAMKPQCIRPELLSTAKGTSVQRLGYILESVLDCRELADALYAAWTSAFVNSFPVVLNPHSRSKCGIHENRWKIIANEELEVDEL